jgi:hypothetical protein
VNNIRVKVNEHNTINIKYDATDKQKQWLVNQKAMQITKEFVRGYQDDVEYLKQILSIYFSDVEVTLEKTKW